MRCLWAHSLSLRDLETVAVVLLLSLVSARPAWAKKVAIEWAPLPGATQYELEIQRDGKTVAKKKLDDSSWKGQLEFGVYVYQIRAYDRVKRAGAWTAPLPLVVMPAPPEPQSPRDGKKVVLYAPTAAVNFHWETIPGASQYRVEISRDGLPVSSQLTRVASLALKALAPGKYSWKVVAIVQPKGRLPASFEARQWESKASAESEFKIDHAQLEHPAISYPVGSIVPPTDGQVKFKWSKVEGAESYELDVYSKEIKGRLPAAAEPKALAHVTVMDNIALVKLPPQGQYSWKVRALANIDDAKTAGAVGPQSVADFKLDKNAAFFDGAGYVAFSTMLAPYNYQVISPAAGVNGTASSSAVTGRLSGEYWFKPQWGIGTAFELTDFSLANQTYLRKGFELVVKHRINFDLGSGSSRYKWSLSPKLGLEERDYVEVLPLSSEDIQVYGAQFGLDLRKQLSEKLSLGIKAAYFLPVMPIASGVSGLTKDASYRNLSLGAQMLYWLDRRWGMGAGAYIEKRSISFGTQGAPAGTPPEVVSMDGTYFFGSIIYSFGR